MVVPLKVEKDMVEQGERHFTGGLRHTGGLSWDGLVWLLANLVVQTECSCTDLILLLVGHGASTMQIPEHTLGPQCCTGTILLP